MIALHATMGRVEVGLLWYALLYNTFDWLRYILPMAIVRRII